MKCTILLALTLGLVQSAFAQKSQGLLALEGSWAGSYTCQGTGIAVDLTIYQHTEYPNGMGATFRFGSSLGDPSRVWGEFWMKVSEIGFNQYRFEPVQWVQRPEGVEWFTMTGQASGGGISGTINHPLCTSFQVYPAER